MLTLAIVSVVLMSLDHRTEYGNTARSGLSLVVYLLRYIMSIPSDMLGWGQTTFVSRGSLQEQNATLLTQNKILKAQLHKSIFTEAENIRLRNLLKSSKRVGERILIAELLSVNLDPFRQQVVINKGLSERDIFTGQRCVSTLFIFLNRSSISSVPLAQYHPSFFLLLLLSSTAH